ncbi:MAG: hypothetical protein DME50_03405 [Verrucomicrobia bacterium]|nr:MAG: hypothetical protein DME85_08120 [Verrucomicrobiota bacterium]PYK67178.1 MAG: hypothetical protein DME50_03405 [Verrucomicrobiota bacterium]
MSKLAHANLGSARVSRAGFGVTPKQAFLLHRYAPSPEVPIKVRNREDALANTRDACSPQK